MNVTLWVIQGILGAFFLFGGGMKLVAFDTAVNVSIGLPIDRVSVDHGTAFDIAGTGKAKHINMLHAITYGRKLAATRNLR